MKCEPWSKTYGPSLRTSCRQRHSINLKLAECPLSEAKRTWPKNGSCPLMTQSGHRPDRNPAAQQSAALQRCAILSAGSADRSLRRRRSPSGDDRRAAETLSASTEYKEPRTVRGRVSGKSKGCQVDAAVLRRSDPRCSQVSYPYGGRCRDERCTQEQQKVRDPRRLVGRGSNTTEVIALLWIDQLRRI